MARTITIKGTGSITVRPDLIVLSLTVESREKKYADAVTDASEKIRKLNTALEGAGFPKDSAKTINYHVRADYSMCKDRRGQMQRQLNGYVCVHRLKVEFDCDTGLLGRAVGAVTASLSSPQLDISFTVRDKNAVTQELLGLVAADAKRKAGALCTAAGASLGQLLTVDYSWNEICLCSPTNLCVDDTCELAAPMALPRIDIRPDDIPLSDSATFVWEIV